MKTLITACITLLLAATSCNKCYVCDGGNNNPSVTYCKGERMYDIIKSGGTPTDNNGQELMCHSK
ncbi:MAG TPA: hypothetical protein PLW44_07065 [Chitinophagales bacterium]|nr:hypothetical protein [Chitinophagales bacterium]